ncbi:TetR/AcrR family transcriptional regulator [Candidatus Gracilibacteria bacterium]|nr:TetR/AcrR family transcriptional regulator [Candidatus Gracilibacteria bacterium]NJM86290.1 TetR/AcrR family transcriptional regulator [Hydrococcus sp. RU_2_2]NJP18104.1 TetR/AcrR family transcriptional regulator [Hydrococcus sp. CRU_1_1]NJQ96721.1 TetR/AcrR family transcriptional regulator [Hydrococcus sp. CSU_1_8]
MVNVQKTKSPFQTRDTILQATSQVILDKGIEGLTLDAVAKEAGVSKGGLLYHFPSKEALIVGTIAKLIDDHETALQQEFDRDENPGTSGQWVRAYLRATLNYDKQALALIAPLAQAAIANPDLLKPALDLDKRWQQKLEASGFDLVEATIIQLAIDGLWLSESFNIGSLEEPLRSQVIEKLLAMTYGRGMGETMETRGQGDKGE